MSFLFAILIATAIAIRFNKKIVETLAVSVFLCITVLYISGLITSFIPGIIIILGTVLLSLVYIIVMGTRKKILYYSNQIFWGLFICILIAVYFLIVSYGRYLTDGDEFVHWGIAVKYYYTLNDYSNIALTSDRASRYPPAATIWNYFTIRFWPNCSTGFMYWGQQVFILSLFAPLFNFIDNTKKDYLKSIAISLFIVSVPYFIYETDGDTQKFTLLGADLLVGAVFVYALMMFRKYLKTNDRYYYIASVWSTFILVLTKQTGLVMAFLLIYIVFSIYALEESSLKEIFLNCFCYFIVSLIAYVSWNIFTYISDGEAIVNWFTAYLNFRNAEVVFITLIVIAVIIVFCRKSLRTKLGRLIYFMPIALFFIYVVAAIVFLYKRFYDYKYIKDFIIANIEFFITNDVVSFGYLFRIPLLLFIVALIGLATYMNKRNIVRKSDLNMLRALLLGFIMYALFRVAVHLLFQMDDPTYTSSYERYLYSYYVVFIVLFVVVLFEIETILSSTKISIILLLFTLVFAKTPNIFTEMFTQTDKHDFAGLQDMNFVPGDRIVMVDVGIDDDRCEWDFFYQVMPAQSNDARNMTWYLNNDLSGRRLTFDEVNDLIELWKANYVYLRHIDDGFAEYYSELFTEESQIVDGSFYTVNYVEGQLRLDIVEKGYE